MVLGSECSSDVEEGNQLDTTKKRHGSAGLREEETPHSERAGDVTHRENRENRGEKLEVEYSLTETDYVQSICRIFFLYKSYQAVNFQIS